MKTEIYTQETLKEAAETIKNGGLIAVPTETVYGLGCNGLNPECVLKVYEVKGRPAIKPLSLMVSGKESIKNLCYDIPKTAYTLAAKYWPGPLTIVLKALNIVPDIVRAGGTTVALRCPKHDLTLELIRLADLPLTAPSANPSGEKSPVDAQQVCNYFDGKIDGIIDGGPCLLGTESTIIDLSQKPYRILREAALSKDEITNFLVSKMKIIGIAGGTGSGKTTALQAVAQAGGAVIDCDSLYHELLESDIDMLLEIREFFPDAFDDGQLDRKALGRLVFNDTEMLTKLNCVTHKYVKLAIERKLKEFAMEGLEFVAIDAVELFSSGISDDCDVTLAITANRTDRIRRIEERDSISSEYAVMRVEAQHSDAYYSENADVTIENNDDLETFTEKVNNFIRGFIYG